MAKPHRPLQPREARGAKPIVQGDTERDRLLGFLRAIRNGAFELALKDGIDLGKPSDYRANPEDPRPNTQAANALAEEIDHRLSEEKGGDLDGALLAFQVLDTLAELERLGAEPPHEAFEEIFLHAVQLGMNDTFMAAERLGIFSKAERRDVAAEAQSQRARNLNKSRTWWHRPAFEIYCDIVINDPNALAKGSKKFLDHDILIRLMKDHPDKVDSLPGEQSMQRVRLKFDWEGKRKK